MLTPANGRNGARNKQLGDGAGAGADALDIRDARTARHSQTVARLADDHGRELGLSEADRRAGAARRPAARRRQHRHLQHAAEQARPARATRSGHEIRRHSEIGARILANARLGDIGQWVLAHHERVDGAGFPFGISNGSIPLEARILSVADAFEAMISERPHRPALTRRTRRCRSCAATPARSSTWTWSTRSCARLLRIAVRVAVRSRLARRVAATRIARVGRNGRPRVIDRDLSWSSRDTAPPSPVAAADDPPSLTHPVFLARASLARRVPRPGQAGCGLHLTRLVQLLVNLPSHLAR